MERYSGVDQPVLIGQTGPLNGQRWSLENELVMGRDPSCAIVISDRQVSRFHARVSLTEQGVLLEDLGSKNGTFRNGNLVTDPVYLSDGDQVQVAMVQSFVYLSSDATMPLEYDLQFEKPKAKEKLVLDIRSRRVWVNDKEVLPPLSVPQFRLLQALFDQRGEVVERQSLIDIIWGEDEAQGVSEQAFDALVRRLRERLASIDPSHVFIVTVRGHGLRLDIPSD